ncbi:MAG: hypothetical protein KAI99_10790, partial [Cyclobacteriaceae bacterium]|nr:hypothetical protein [Cyclobacteriaceae bacterium]
MSNRPISPTIFFVLFLICISAGSVAQQSGINFKHLSTVDGLSNFTVLSIAQDHQGFMWFGTMDGLNRFDGEHIKIYREEPDDPNSLGNNFIWSLLCSSDSGLWVGTYRGLYYYDFYHDNFHLIPIIDGIGNKNIAMEIRSLLVDENWLWVGTNRGLFRYDLFLEKIIPFEVDINEHDRPIGNVIALEKSNDGTLWIGDEKGLMKYQNGKFNRIDIEINSQHNVSFQGLGISIDNTGKVWFGTHNLELGLIIYDPETKSSITLSKKDGYLPHNRVKSLFRFPDGNIWLGTRWGLAIINEKTYDSRHIIHERYDPGSISHNSIRQIFQSKSGVIWIGTYSGGVNYIDPESQRIAHFTDKYNNENSINFNIVSTIFEDKNKNFWIGTEYGGGVNIYDPSTGRFHVIKKEEGKNSLVDDNIKSIIEDQRGRKFIATQNGLSIYSPAKNSFINISKKPGTRGILTDLRVHDLCLDKLGNIWVGTRGGPNRIQMYDVKCDSIINFFPVDTEFPVTDHVIINSMIYDEKRDIVWAGSDKGLDGFSIRTKEYLKDKNFLSMSERLEGITINDLMLDKKGIFWIATFGHGLYLMDLNSFRLRKVNRDEGLVESSIYALTNDNDGYVWASVNAHLLKIKASNSIVDPITYIEKYGIQEGFPPQQYFRTSAYKGSDGTLYFGGDDGFISFNPREVENIVFHPSVAILDILVNGISLEVISKTTNQFLNVASLNKVVLAYKQSSFAVQFIAPNYINPDNTWYPYQLSGIHDSWQDLGNSNAINITKLKAGNYELKIKASSDPDNFAQEFTTINMEIKPPYWGTPLAYLIYVILI